MALRFLICLMALLAGLAHAYALDVKELKTPEGITAWFAEDRSVPLVTVHFSFARGILHDPEGEEGVALLLSGLVDEGAGGLDGEEFRARMEDIGMRMGFDAELDRFYGRYSVPSAFHAEGTQLLQTALQDLTFPEAAVERMRRFFLVTTESENRQPQVLANRAALSLALPGHPYEQAGQRGPVALPQMTHVQLRAAHKRIFSRHGLKIAIVGDQSEMEATRFVERVFGALPRGEALPLPQQAKVADGPRLKIVPFEASQTLFQFGQQGVPSSDPDHLAATIAALMTVSTLNDIARQQQGLTYGATFELNELAQASFIVGSMRTANGNAADAYQVIKQSLGLLLFPGPSEGHLESTKVYLKGKYALGFDTTENIATTLLQQQEQGYTSNFLSKRDALIDAVTLNDVKRVINRIIDPEKLIVVAVGKPEGLEEIE
jgi:zinc protease